MQLYINYRIISGVSIFQSIEARKQLYASRGCMTIEWFAHKFHQTLPRREDNSKFYNDKYSPELPVYNRRGPRIGRCAVSRED